MTTLDMIIDDRKTYSYTKTITAADVEMFAKASGDDQALHLDEAVAGKSRFKHRIAHGILTAGLISAALGTKVAPGQVVIYMSQTLRFIAPVYLGDTLTAQLKVTGMNVPRRQVTFSARVINQNKVEVLQGETQAMIEPYAE
ncbi:MAG: MaoC family dehydratase [SAR202 cluster bacterium]|nr:MaoC family dehydratase [SAR202 cluster bacterium]